MSDLLIARRLFLSVVTALFVAGCDRSATPGDGSTGSAKDSASAGSSTDSVQKKASVRKSAGGEDVIFYIAGMNKRLKILWGDWPNKVKQALLELDGMESVEDEWERGLESDDDLDLLFVTFDPKQINVAKMQETIRTATEHNFEAKVR